MGLAKNSLGTFVSMILVVLLRFPVAVLSARFLGAEGRGIYYLVFLSVTMGAKLANLGLGPASIYYIGRDRKNLPLVMGNLLAITSVVTVTLLSGGWLFLQYGRPDIYHRLNGWIWGVAGLMLWFQILEGILMQVLSALLRIKEVNIVEVAAAIAHMLLFALLVMLMGLGVGGALLAYTLQSLLTVASYYVLIVGVGGYFAKPDLPLLRACLWFGLKSYLANLMKVLNFRLDAFLVAALASNGVEATGIYSVAVSLAEMLFFIPKSIRRSLFPMVASSNEKEANRLTSAACRHTMFLSVILVLGFAGGGPFAIPLLYGKEFTNAIFPFLLLLPGIVASSQTFLFYSDLNGRGMPGYTTMSSLLSLFFTVILDLALIPNYGIIGAAVASSCAYIVEFLVSGAFFIRQSGLQWKQVLCFRWSDFRYYTAFLRGYRKLTQLAG